ncbi:hypothetical protein [Flavobacterium sp. N502536]|uniref:hypothetical protein n=1 Tax=Flavobacterium sp. N502536 TaxID=2986837 RepID=UPI002223426F|nr:hypothetical protein [Flavobacterium sp. N502536]
MATNINTILSWFKTRSKPTQEQFWASWSSFWHKDEQIPQASISNLTTTLDTKTDQSQFDAHIIDHNAHLTAFEKKLDKGDYNGTAQHLKNDIDAIEQNLLENYYDISKVNEGFAAKLDKGTYKGTAQDLFDSIPNLNASNLKLEGYPNTRNDGQISMNKVLGTDSTGNLKMYSIAVAPAPWINELIPDSYLPNTTGNIRILGDFFIPQMCDRINNPTAIVLGGVAAIHSAIFISSQEILVNVTTGSIEGNFSCILNNGLSTTKTNSLLIILGIVHKPTEHDWINKTLIDVSEESSVKLLNYGSEGNAEWIKEFDISKNFEIRMSPKKTPLGSYYGNDDYGDFTFRLLNFTSNEIFFGGQFYHSLVSGPDANNVLLVTTGLLNKYNVGGTFPTIEPLNTMSIKFKNGVMFCYFNTTLLHTFLNFPTSNLKLVLKPKFYDFTDIKYIELAT